MNELLIVAIVIGLIPVYPGWLMCQKAFFISRFPIVTVLVCLLLPGLLAVPFFYLPFWLAKDQERESSAMMVDFVLWGICPLGLIALIAYVLDHVEERALRSIIAGAACFAITLLPIAYYFFAADVAIEFGITLESSDGP